MGLIAKGFQSLGKVVGVVAGASTMIGTYGVGLTVAAVRAIAGDRDGAKRTLEATERVAEGVGDVTYELTEGLGEVAGELAEASLEVAKGVGSVAGAVTYGTVGAVTALGATVVAEVQDGLGYSDAARSTKNFADTAIDRFAGHGQKVGEMVGAAVVTKLAIGSIAVAGLAVVADRLSDSIDAGSDALVAGTDGLLDGSNELAAAALPAAAFPAASSHEVMFAGIGDAANIVDSQGFRPTCAAETIENILQIYRGDHAGAYNDYSDWLTAWGRDALVAPPVLTNGLVDWVIPPTEWQNIYATHGIPTQWMGVDHQAFETALQQHRPIQIIVDPGVLWGQVTPSSHSVALLDAIRQPDGQLFYRIADSANAQNVYAASVIEQAALSAQQRFNISPAQCALVPQIPAAAWPIKT